MNIKICPVCGNSFGAFKFQRYCSTGCRMAASESRINLNKSVNNKKYYLKKHPIRNEKIECKVCGKEFVVRRGYGTGRGSPTKYCSPECRAQFMFRKDKYDLVCVVCGKSFWGSKRRKTCSEVCRKQHFISLNDMMIKTCPVCGETRESKVNYNSTFNNPISMCRNCSEKCQRSEGIKQLSDNYLKKNIFHVFGIRDPDQTLIEVVRQQISFKRSLKQLKQWRCEHESDSRDVQDK